MNENRIAIIGLGYVGLPLAIEFSRHFTVIGFDTDEERIAELKQGIDRTQEADIAALQTVMKESSNTKGLRFTSNAADISAQNIYIITVPTPINVFKAPDLSFLLNASAIVGKSLKKGDIVIYESTVYPGCTEEDCVPVLEKCSGLLFNKDFFCGYSPERINPGDKVNTLTKIKKVTSGSTPEIATKVNELYKTIITAGTHMAPGIKVAEASKAIENAQRDVNISFINELALIFDRIGIDTMDVIDAASTKWNFLKYKPGLVGGHCIGVDPYYLAHKAVSLGYHPQVILSGRRVNDNMGMFVANKVVKLMIQNALPIKGGSVLILGFTFKENCPDIRNTRVIDIYNELIQFGLKVSVCDPWANEAQVKDQYNISIEKEVKEATTFDAIILTVAHDAFRTVEFEKHKNKDGIIFDTKAFLDRRIVNGRL